jgi:hypothetical protein
MAETKKKQAQKVTAAYIKQVREQHEQDRDKWAFYIGHIMLVFTEIEDITLHTIEWFSPLFSEFSKTLLLEKRIELLATILDSHDDLTDDVKNEFKSVLKKAHKLIITSDSEGVILTAGGVISSARNQEKKMDLQQLVSFLDEAQACHIELYHAKNKANKQFRNAQDLRYKRERRRQSAAARRARKSSVA